MLRNLGLDLDLSKVGKDVKLQLAFPNKTIKKNITNVTQASLDGVEINGLPKLTFEIPHKIQKRVGTTDEIETVDNPDIKMIKEKMLIKVTWYNKKRVNWFRVTTITQTDSQDFVNMRVEADALQSELRATNVTTSEEPTNAIEYFTHVLSQTTWKLGYVSDKVKDTYRSFDDNKKTRYEAINNGLETFGAIAEWDEENRVLNILSISDIREFRGVVLKKENYVSSLEIESNADDIVTRLYVYGNEKKGIEKVNPTGMAYIEDFSYFMFPFERDINKNVISHSDYMSDDLCHAILDLKVLQDEYNPRIKDLQDKLNKAYGDLSKANMQLVELEGQLVALEALLDTAKATNDLPLVATREKEVQAKEIEIFEKKEEIKSIQDSIEMWEKTIVSYQELISTTSFTQELQNELSLFIYEQEFSDDRYIEEDELYKAGKEQFDKYQRPVRTFNIELASFVNSIESQHIADRLQIGEEVLVKSTKLKTEYKSIVLGYNVDFMTGDYNLIISDNMDDINSLDKLATLIYKADSSSTILNNNKYKWDNVTSIKSEVEAWRDKEIKAVENRIIAGANESVVIDNRGIQAHNPDFPDERIIVQSGVVALSRDGGKTWSTSITPYGVNAETIIGKIIAGENLIITNDNGSFIIDQTGLTINMDDIHIMSGQSGSEEDMIQLWNNLLLTYDEIASDNLVNEYEKNQLEKQWTKIVNIHGSMLEQFIKGWKPLEENGIAKPEEYNEYIKAYEDLNKYLNTEKQTDGFALLDKANRKETTEIDPIVFAEKFKEYETKKQAFESIISMKFTKASIDIMEEGISLNYTKNKEIVTQLNLSEEGIRIDGKLLEINAETHFNKDLVMDAGVIRDKDNGIIIDLNQGEITLNKPIHIGADSNLVSKEDLDKLDLEAHTFVLTNDSAVIPTDKNGMNGDYSTAISSAFIYKGTQDVTDKWKITTSVSVGITGELVGNTYSVKNLTKDSGIVTFKATLGTATLTKTFNVTKAKAGLDGSEGKVRLLSLNVDSHIMTFTNDLPKPEKQTVNVIADLIGIDKTVVWKIVPVFGGKELLPLVKVPTNNVIEITEKDLTGNIDLIKVTATVDDLSDTVSIVKVKNGDGIKNTRIEYQIGDSGTVQPTDVWSIVLPQPIKGKYLWTRTTTTYTDDTKIETFSVSYYALDGQVGENGVGIKSTVITYGQSTNGSSYAGITWTSAIPTVTLGNFLWTKTVWTYTDNTSETGYSVSRSGTDGASGKDGIAGKDGKGISSTTITYGLSTTDTVEPTKYTSNVPTLVKGQYLWTKTVWKYTDTTTETGYTKTYIAKDGNNGEDGIAGKDGVGIKNTTFKYGISTTGIAKPSNWSTTVPTVPEGQFLWTETTWTYTDNTSEKGYSVAKQGEKGPQGDKGQTGQSGLDTYVHKAWSWSADGKDRFTDKYPNENLIVNRMNDGINYPMLANNDLAGFTAKTNNERLSDNSLKVTTTEATDPYFRPLNRMSPQSLGGVGAKLYLSFDYEVPNGSYLRLRIINFVGRTEKFYTGKGSDKIELTVSSSTTHYLSFDPTKEQGSVYEVGLWYIIKNLKIENDDFTIYTPSPKDDYENAYPKYEGYYSSNDTVQSTNPSDYTWSVIRGENGVGIEETVIVYQVGSSGTTAPTGTWTTTIPTVAKGSYLWTRTTITYTDKTTSISYSTSYSPKDGEKGKDSITGFLTNESISLSSNVDGLVSDYKNANGIFEVYDGITKKTGTSVKYSVIAQDNITVTIDANGKYVASGFVTGKDKLTAYATLRAVYGGVTLDKQLTLSKAFTGATGSSASSYWVTPTVNVLATTPTGRINPEAIGFNAYTKSGTSNATVYNGRFIIETSVDGKVYTVRYTSTKDEPNCVYTVDIKAKFVKVKMYQAGATTYLLDEQTIPVLDIDGDIYQAWCNDVTNYKDFTREYPNENLINNTISFSSGWSPSWNIQQVTREITNDGLKIIAKSSAQTGVGEPINVVPNDGDVYVLSMLIRGTGLVEPYFISSTQGNRQFGAKTIKSQTEFEKMSFSLKISGKYDIVDNISILTRDSNWIEIKKESIKLEIIKPNNPMSPTIYLPSPQDNPSRYPMQYIGYSTKDSTNPKDFRWTPNADAVNTNVAWSNSQDGRVDFTTTYPNENKVESSTEFLMKHTLANGIVINKSEINNGISISLEGEKKYSYLWYFGSLANGLPFTEVGKEYTISFDLKTNRNMSMPNGITYSASMNECEMIYSNFDTDTVNKASTTKQRIYVVFKPNAKTTTSNHNLHFMSNASPSISPKWIAEITNVSIQLGNNVNLPYLKMNEKMKYIGYSTKPSKNYLDYKWSLASDGIKTYKAWADAEDGSINFGREYPNENTYSTKDTELQGIGTGQVSGLERNTDDAPNGFKLTGYKDSSAGLRLNNVITENGLWTVSFWVRGSQNVSIRFSLGICDLEIEQFATTTDNSWKYITKTVNVTNQSDLFNFVDFEHFAWAYFFIKDIKVEKADKPSSFTTSPKDSLVDSVMKYSGISVKDSDDPNDYEWVFSSEFAQAVSQVGIDTAQKIAEDAKNTADNAVQNEEFYSWLEQDYENQQKELKDISQKNQEDLTKMEGRTTAIEQTLGENKIKWNFIDNSFDFSEEGMFISNSNSKMRIQISSDKIVFWDNNVDVATITGEQLTIKRGLFLDSATIGNHVITKYSDTSSVTIIRYVGKV